MSAADSTGEERADNHARKVTGPEKRVAVAVQLARRKLDALEQDWAKQRHIRLTALRERLHAAEQLATTDASRAAAMYRAIINLHGNDGWAEEIVHVARERLATLKLPSNEP
jgi:hypothetical protein